MRGGIIARVITDRLAEFAAAGLSEAFAEIVGAHPGSRIYTGKDGSVLLVTGEPVAAFNILIVERDRWDADEIERLAGLIAAAGLPWSLVVRDEPVRDLLAIANRYGLSHRRTEPLMLCLRADARLRGPRAEGPVIRTIRSAERQVHGDLYTASFGTPADIYFQLMREPVFDAEWATTYVAELDGVPVATCYSVRTGDSVGIFTVGVPPEFRGRGYGRLMTERAMTDAFESGATAAYLQSSEVALKLYESMGFRTVETWTYLS